ncbi:glycine cleavage system aminomethyltransferase GcvT [Paenochrobactrum glaciei]|uniref:aminomethyltransferase n=1 Tax=Paenochrobactrum glaciei TaxID=486407 RepID=A0ABN1FRK4_9HYPH
MGDTAQTTLKTLPLQDLHEAAKARFGGFAGWNMPITYPLGVMKEHLHVREQAGLFDISHMRVIEISGDDAAKLLAEACPLDPLSIPMNQSKYTFLLNENAGVEDDLIVTRLGENRFMIVANAGNADADIAHLNKVAAGKSVTVNPLDRVLLALQGPAAADVAAKAGVPGGELTFMTGIEPKADWFVTRSGYTGEDGFEIALPEKDARDLLAKLFADERVQWIGLAARDSLRLEAGLCLHGQDITPEINPVDAGLLWAVPKPVRETAGFIGAKAFLEKLAAGAKAKRVGLKPEGRQPVRADVELFDADGNKIGRVTSGGFGPSAGHPVAMGYVTPEFAAVGSRVFADIRGNLVPLDVHSLPFTPHHYHKG